MEEEKKDREAVIVIRYTEKAVYINVQNEGQFHYHQLNGMLMDLVLHERLLDVMNNNKDSGDKPKGEA